MKQKTLPLGEYSGLGGYTIKEKLTCAGNTLVASPLGLRLKLPTLAREP